MNSNELLYAGAKKGYLLEMYTKFDGGYYRRHTHIPDGNQVIIVRHWREKRSYLSVQYFPFITTDNTYVIL